MSVFFKNHSDATQSVIGVCDQDCLGKILKKNKFCFNVSENFFKNELISIEEAILRLKNATNFNAVGKNIIDALIKENLIHSEGVLYIDDIPIALKFVF